MVTIRRQPKAFDGGPSLKRLFDLVPLRGSPEFSRAHIIAYWVATVLVSFQLGSGGAGDILRIQPVVEGMTHLGYPVYFCVILGAWKVLGAVAVLAPRLPRLKEWAYAGTVFDLTGAAASHLAVGDPAIKLMGPIIFTGLAVASWALRPSIRRLDDASS